MTLATNADFLAAIAENPQDDTPRLIFADWLEECGNQPERAEFIRVQCELARMPARTIHRPKLKCPHQSVCEWKDVLEAPKTLEIVWEDGLGLDSLRAAHLRRREKKLLKHWLCEWNSEFYGAIAKAEVKEALATGRSLRCDPLSPARTCEFHRGFIATISLSFADFIQYAAVIIEAVPMLEEVRLSDAGPLEMRFGNGLLASWAFSQRFVWPAAFDDAVNLAYSNRDHALAAMSRCCLAFAREQLAKRRSLTLSAAKRSARSDR